MRQTYQDALMAGLRGRPHGSLTRKPSGKRPRKMSLQTCEEACMASLESFHGKPDGKHSWQTQEAFMAGLQDILHG